MNSIEERIGNKDVREDIMRKKLDKMIEEKKEWQKVMSVDIKDVYERDKEYRRFMDKVI